VYSIIGAILLMGTGGWIAGWQIESLRDDALDHAEAELERRAETVSIQLQHSSGHLERIRHTVEALLEGVATPDPPPWALLHDGGDGPYIMLQSSEEDGLDGVFFKLGTLGGLRTDTDARRRVGLFMYLLGILKIEFRVRPGLVTTWYRRFGEAVVIYPGITKQDFRAAYNDVEVVEQLTLDTLGMPFWSRLRADVNPKGDPFWTPPYTDILGKGTTVTYAAPVREAGAVVGMVGTDVILNDLAGLMKPPTRPGGQYLLVGEEVGLILAPAHPHGGDAAPPTLAELLPPEQRDDRHERRVAIEGTPWELVWTIDRWDMAIGLLPNSLVPFLLLTLLSIVVMTGHLAVRRRFVQPAIALVRHMEAEARGEAPSAPKVPEVWRQWFQSVTDTFKLRHIAENLPAVVGRLRWTGTGAPTILFGSAGLREMFGLPEGTEVTGETILSMMLPEDREGALALFLEVLESGRTVRRDMRFRRPDGRICWIRTFGSPRGEDDELIDYISMDVTKEVEAEELRRRFEARMQQAQKAESLGVLAGGVAHDFNNILMGMIGSAELAELELPSDSALREHLREIIKGGRRASELAHQMLAYAGRGRLSLEHVSVNALVRDLRGLMEASIPKTVDLHMEVTEPLPIIEGDPTQLRQVIMNLVINAAESIDDTPGTITITTSAQEWRRRDLTDAELSDDLAPGHYVSIRVRDTGCGMDAETRRRVFDPFFSTKFLGRGLGLASVLGIVRGHTGAIGVASAPERGTTFQVLLPSLEEANEWVNPTPPPMEVVERVDRGLALVVDDEPAIRKVGGMMLRRLGFEVLAAEDGIEALDILSSVETAPALVLLDYSMPRMDGPQTLTAIRAAWPDLPVFLCSGYDASELEADEVMAATAYLQKPIRFGELAEALDKILDAEAPPKEGEPT